MDYKIFKQALTEEECQNFIEFGKSQYPLLKPDQIYPNRGYPGFTLQNAQSVLEKLATFIDKSGFNIAYDYTFGTGVNFINAQKGEFIGQHIDRPLIQLDDNLQVLPGYENRYCSGSVHAYIGGQNEINIEGDIVEVNSGDIIVLKGFTAHAMKKIESGTFYGLGAFYCSSN